MQVAIILTLVLLGHNACQAMTMEDELEIALMGTNKDVNKRSSDTLLDEIMEHAMDEAEEMFKRSAAEHTRKTIQKVQGNYKKRSVEAEANKYSLPLHVLQIATREIKKRFANRYEGAEIEKWIEKSKVFVRRDERARKMNKRSMDCPYKVPTCTKEDEHIRRYSGACNNKNNPLWGKSETPYIRVLDPVYSYNPVTYTNDNLRITSHKQGARGLSNCLHNFTEPFIPSVPATSVLLECFGQFLTHDISDALLATEKNTVTDKDEIVKCDGDDCKGHKECAPIAVPDDEKVEHFKAKKCIRCVRLKPTTNDDCSSGQREQLNGVSPLIDLSVVYGNSKEMKDKLIDTGNMEFPFALLKLSKFDDATDKSAGYLPINKDDDSCHGRKCTLSGDHRADMQPCLLFAHLLFARLHNLIVRGLSKATGLTGEKLFEKARKVNIAIFQHIVYNEFLRKVLGDKIPDDLNQDKPYRGYDDSINPSLIHGYMVGAGRYGHSRMSSRIPKISEDFQHVKFLFLSQTYFKPKTLYGNTTGSDAALCNGLLFQSGYLGDGHCTHEVKDLLFATDGHKFLNQVNKFDLPAFNIQRGYDVGLAGYSAWRKFCGLSAVGTFKELEAVVGAKNAAQLKNCYGHDKVTQYDLFSTGLFEEKKNNAIVGETFKCLIEKQYTALKLGDSHWYERQKHFNEAELTEIRKMTISSIICLTTPLKNYAVEGFVLGGDQQECSKFQKLDFTKFTKHLSY